MYYREEVSLGPLAHFKIQSQVTVNDGRRPGALHPGKDTIQLESKGYKASVNIKQTLCFT